MRICDGKRRRCIPPRDPGCYYDDNNNGDFQQQQEEELLVWLPTVSVEFSQNLQSHEQRLDGTSGRSTVTAEAASRRCHDEPHPPQPSFLCCRMRLRVDMDCC